MPLSLPLPRLLGLRPVAPGEPVPSLSLTAEEGTWVRLADLAGRLHAVLLFFRSLRDDATDAWLAGYDARLPAFDALDAVVYGVTHHRTDALRDHRARLGLAFHLLYDPLALRSRRFGCSRHVRPLCRPATVLVSREGAVLASRRGRMPAAEALECIARHDGRAVPEVPSGRAFTGVRDPGAPKAAVRDLDAAAAADLLAAEPDAWVLLDVRPAGPHAAWHPPGALHVPLDELPHRYQEIRQNTDVICLSETGGQSAAAAEFLTSVGFSDVVNVVDGVSGWPGAPGR